MKRLRRLCEGTRAINALAQITILGVPDRDDWWVIRVAVGPVVLIETAAGPLDKVLTEAGKKLQSLSQRMLLAVSPNGDEEAESDRSSSIPPNPPKIKTIPPGKT